MIILILLLLIKKHFKKLLKNSVHGLKNMANLILDYCIEYGDDYTTEEFEEYMNVLESHMFELNRLNSLLKRFK